MKNETTQLLSRLIGGVNSPLCSPRGRAAWESQGVFVNTAASMIFSGLVSCGAIERVVTPGRGCLDGF